MYQEQPYDRSAYVNSIAESLSAPARIRANALRQTGAIQANAQQQRGQIAGQTAQQIGQTIAAIPQQIQQQKIAGQEAQMREAQLATITAQKEARAALGAAIRQYGDDNEAIAKDVAAKGFPDQAASWLKITTENANNIESLRGIKTKYQQHQRETIGDLAYSANTPDDFASALGVLAASGEIDEETAHKLADEVTSNPQAAEEMRAKYLPFSPRYQKEQEEILKAKGGKYAPGEVSPILGEEPPAGERVATPAELETARHNKELERIATLTAGRADAAAAEAARHNKAIEATSAQTAEASMIRAKRSGALETDPDMPSLYRNAIDRSIMSIPAVRRGTVVQLANRLFAEGNLDELKSTIKQAAIEGENVDTKNQVRGREATMAALADTKLMLQELKAKGVPTNWFSGTAEDLARKLGTSTNPEYVRLSTRLMDTLITYRRAATGVQFSQKETEQYAQMFPNYKQTLPVNLATIDGMLRAIKTNDRVFWEQKLGKDGADLVVGEAANPLASVPSGVKITTTVSP